MSVRELILAVHEDTGEVDPETVWAKVAAALGVDGLPGDVADAFNEMGVDYARKVLAGVRRTPLPSADEGGVEPSKRWSNIAKLRAAGVWVPGVGHRRTDDLTPDDVAAVAADRKRRALELEAEAERWKRLYQTLVERGAGSVADLDDVTLIEVMAR